MRKDVLIELTSNKSDHPEEKSQKHLFKEKLLDQSFWTFLGSRTHSKAMNFFFFPDKFTDTCTHAHILTHSFTFSCETHP